MDFRTPGTPHHPLPPYLEQSPKNTIFGSFPSLLDQSLYFDGWGCRLPEMFAVSQPFWVLFFWGCQECKWMKCLTIDERDIFWAFYCCFSWSRLNLSHWISALFVSVLDGHITILVSVWYFPQNCFFWFGHAKYGQVRFPWKNHPKCCSDALTPWRKDPQLKFTAGSNFAPRSQLK